MKHNVVIAIRTHFWDETIDEIARRLASATTNKVVVAADETNGTIDVPTQYRKIAHSTAVFEAMGLPLVPTPRRALWFNGDYPIYHLLDELDFDNLIMIEGDCAAVGTIDTLLDSLITDEVDFATKNFGSRDETYPWYDASLAWFGPRFEKTTVMGGIFPVVFVSRSAAEELRRARIEMASETGGDIRNWPHCEAFAATHLHLKGFKCSKLSAYADVSEITVDIPVHSDEIDAAVPIAGKVKFFHPVLSGVKYDQKWRSYYRKLSKTIDQLTKDNKKLIKENNKLAKAIVSKEKKIEKQYSNIEKSIQSLKKGKLGGLLQKIKRALTRPIRG